MNKTSAIIILLGNLGILSLALAQSAEQKGLAIATESNRRDDGFGDHSANMKMILRNRHGQESIRNIRVRTLEQADDGDKTLTIFDHPRDVKGTALLTFTHKKGADDQWLYLPALRKVRRIVSNNKANSFMGSEFSFEDMTSQEVEKYTYKYLRDEPCPGDYASLQCFVFESYPVDKKYSGYTKQTIWMDQIEYRTIKIDFFDRKSSRLKTAHFSGYQQYLGQYWRPTSIFMENYQNGKSTLLKWDNYQFKTGLKERDFTKSRLRSIK